MNRPKVGVGVIIITRGTVLLHKRRGAHGSGTWSFPGGHLEFNETIEDCAKREVREETGMKIDTPDFLTITNDIFPEEGKHYITIFMKAQVEDQEPQNLEPEKCEQWRWFFWDKLPSPLFLPVQNLLKQRLALFR